MFDSFDDIPDAESDAFVAPSGDARAPGSRDAASARDAEVTKKDAAAFDAGERDATLADAIAESGIDAGPDASDCVLYVDAVNGNDSFDGSSQFPFKTITKGLASVAGFDACVPIVQVRPGTYDDANGEVFPLVVPPNVTLLGDEALKGDPNGTPVRVHGGGLAYVPVLTALIPRSGATIAGLDIELLSTSEFDAGALFSMGVVLYQATSDVTLRNNTLNGGHVGVYVTDSTQALVTGNVFTGCFVGFALVGGTAKVESNAASGNSYGFESDVIGADFGGGALGSAGHNVISCNTINDLFVSIGGVPAANDYWDHVPPSQSSQVFGPEDIILYGGMPAAITTGAMLANPNCP